MPKCRNCGKNYSYKQAYKKELKLNGCRYYCCWNCCLEHWVAFGGKEEDLSCPCF